MNEVVNTEDLLPLNTIRVETVLSRFPVHRLSKRGNIQIEINERGEAGELLTKWEVSYNTKYGRSEEHTSELQSRQYLVCRLLLEKKKTNNIKIYLQIII